MTMYMALVILMRNDQFRMSGNGPRATRSSSIFFCFLNGLPKKGLYFSENIIDNENQYQL
jgi:hypothetical protein